MTLFWFFVIAVQKACHPETPTQVGAILVIAQGDGQIRPYRNAPVPWQEPKVPAKAGNVQREALNPAQPVPQSPRLNK